jgi:hypothetical protein
MLKRDIDFWLSPTAGGVNLAIAVKVSRSNPKVDIEVWGNAIRGSLRIQNTTISKVRDRVTVVGKDVTIPFLDLFGRPASHPAERDVVIKEDRLSAMARKIWKQQGFI